MKRIQVPICLFFVTLTLLDWMVAMAGQSSQPLQQTEQERYLSGSEAEAVFRAAEANAELSRQSLIRAHAVLCCWLGRKDPNSHLVSEHWDEGYWQVKNAAADIYSSLVVISSLTDHAVRDGFLTLTLADEKRLCNRLGRLPDDWSFSKRDFLHAESNTARIIFGASEYCRDGLLRITEWTGPSHQWYARLTELIDEIYKYAPYVTEYGRLPAMDHEVCGEMLQTLARLYWMTGDQRYLQRARAIGDFFLFNKLPTRERCLRLTDHGCEVISGLSELFLIEARLDSERAQRYCGPMKEMLDRVLEVGTNPDGFFFCSIDPVEGKVLSTQLSDCWGYLYNAYYTYYLATGQKEYRDVVERVLRNLPKYIDHDWFDGSDGNCDAFESAIDLLNRIPLEKSWPFLDRTLQRTWLLQQADGSVERWYGDGSFGRACIMYALWKTKGCQLQPWRSDLRLGAEQVGDVLYLTACADTLWTGRLIFDRPRHAELMKLPTNYPRINELPEWFAASADSSYDVAMTPGGCHQWSGKDMVSGVPLKLEPLQPVRIIVRLSQPDSPELPLPAAADKLPPAKPISYRPLGSATEPAQSDELSDMMKHYLCDIAKAYDETVTPPDSPVDWPAMRRQLRQTVREVIGLEPLPSRCLLNVQNVGTLDRGEYVIEKIIFQSWPGVFVPAAVYIPKKAEFPVPAVLNPTGHGAHKATQYVQERNIGLCLRGYITMTYDTVGQGERRAGAGYDHNVGVQSFLVGRSNTTYMVWDSIRALDYLCSRPDVDNTRIAVTGHSGGGLNTKYLAAVDERITCAVPAGHIRTYSSMIPNWFHHCICCWTPNAMRYIKTGEVCAILAPHPQLIMANTDDEIVPLEGTRRAYIEAAKVYSVLGVRDRIDEKEFAGPHAGYRPAMRQALYVWLDRWLGGIENPDPTERIVGIFLDNSPMLRCFPKTGNPSTSDMFTLNRNVAETLPPDMPVAKSSEEALAWQKKHRELVICEVIGALPDKNRPLNAQSKVKEDTTERLIEYVRFEPERGIVVPALFIKPKKLGRLPVVIWISVEGKDAALSSPVVTELLEQGIAVFAIDVRGTGQTAPAGPGADWIVATATVTLGRHIAAMRAYDVVRSLDYLATREDVKQDQISCFGIGHQGCLAGTFAAAIDSRISAVTLNSPLVSFKSYLDNKIVPPIDMAIPSVLKFTDMTHLLALVAPRRLVLVDVEDARGRRLSPQQAGHIYGIPEAVYGAFGTEDRFEVISSTVKTPGF